jgi:hypothetical protein
MRQAANAVYNEIKDWLRIVGVPLVIALGGWWVSASIDEARKSEEKTAKERDLREQKTRLYAELMSKREEADSALRKDMFGKVFDKFFTDRREDPREQVLKLEVLARNFHDALDLSPLFKEVQRQIRTAPTITSEDRGHFEARLVRLARDIGSKQALALEQSGGKIGVYADLGCFLQEKRPIRIYPPELEPDPVKGCKAVQQDAEKAPGIRLPQRGFVAGSCGATDLSTADATCVDFEILLEEFNAERSELVVRFKHSPRPQVDQGAGSAIPPKSQGATTFSVSYFDFPLLDYTRLPNGWRVAVVLQDLKFDRRKRDGVALLDLVYFPASRASLKDKPYFDEMLDQLLQAQAPEGKQPAGIKGPGTESQEKN